ncbi:hypothetical protein B296_00006104 [Ensete ventricosum]|uniref:Uncharacterized protein n=1 Tax=Ensete ventricosum TaxID=4639 RepID=A0A426Z294_ENSVE|nr:hypothetical protein B296_00006104 [Ensete ventricosum]
MFCWIGATIICFQRQEAEVLRDGCVLDFLDEGRATEGALAMLILHPDGLVDILLGDDCLEHSRYGLDLISKPQKSLRSTTETLRLSGGGGGPGSLNRRQYHPGVQEGGFPYPNKGSEGGGCGAPPEVGCVVGGTSSPRLPSAERSCDIRPSF